MYYIGLKALWHDMVHDKTSLSQNQKINVKVLQSALDVKTVGYLVLSKIFQGINGFIEIIWQEM